MHFTYVPGLIAIMLFVPIILVSQNKKKAPQQEIIRTNLDGSGQKIVLRVTAGSKHNYPMMAAWIENIDGDFLQTLYVNQSVAKGFFNYAVKSSGEWEAGEIVRPASLPVWAHSRGIQSSDGLYMPTTDNPVPDALTSATPPGDFTIYSKTNTPLSGKVKVFFEINQSWDWNEYWTNNKSQPSVVYAAEIDLDNPGREYTLLPVGHGHYSGANGEIFTDLNTLTTALQIVDEVKLEVE
jgi:hypothetical protein